MQPACPKRTCPGEPLRYPLAMRTHLQELLRLVKTAACCLWMGGMAVVSVAADTSYLVRRGDTLYGIARAHGLSIGALAERNGLSKSLHLYAGQRLLIPGKTEKSACDPGLPAAVRGAIEKARVAPGRWTRIVVHHSGVDAGTVMGMDRYHREVRHMENGLAYHFVIGNGDGMGDGQIAVGARWLKQLPGGHLASEAKNKTSLGICLVGNFDKHKPSPSQMQRLTALVRALQARCQIGPEAVTTHQQVHTAHTRCPGRYFPTESWLNSLKALACGRGRTKP